ncbi:MAG: universal stress protein [Segetibacter sp.]|nr:universal stress protein [Segetibacter sp.]
MKTILVPTDFSPTAKNAGLYAIELAKQVKATKVVLYNAYQSPVVTEPTMPVVQLIDIDTLKNISETSLNTFKETLSASCPPEIQLETFSEFAILSSNINGVCERTNADIIIMGITGGSKIEEVLIGSSAISVATHTKTPVIIIPPHSTYTAIKKVVLACDFKKVQETTPVAPITKILNATNAELHVINVSNNHKEISGEMQSQKEILNKLLEGFNPQYHFIDSDDFIEAINAFADEQKADLIITIPKKHGLFDGLFRTRHTKQLAFHSHVPLMSIHEEEL